MFFSLVSGHALPEILLLCLKNATLMTRDILVMPLPFIRQFFPPRGPATASTFSYLAPSTSFWTELACVLQLGKGKGNYSFRSPPDRRVEKTQPLYERKRD